jgi:NAD(P)-dependent dehydrogenase (short-subunit alcohol dehydrogenase family)
MAALELTPSTGVVVTGGASGIGLATGRALAEVGRPVALWDVNAEQVERAAGELAAAVDVPVVGLAVDVTDNAGVAAAVDRSLEALGSLGGLCHSAGVVASYPVESLPEETWDRVLAVNLTSQVRLAKALLPHLRAAGPGSAIVAIASINALLGLSSIPAYCASKAGLLGLVRALADEFGPQGIRVNGVCPGYIETPMLARALSDEKTRAAFSSGPLRRLGKPEELGSTVRFLLSDEASFINGIQLPVDGGWQTR